MKVINVFPPSKWETQDSYGRKAIEIAKSFNNHEYYVNRWHDKDAVIYPALGGILMGYPTNFSQYGIFAAQGRRIAVTAWESTKCPSKWAFYLNAVDVISVGSYFTKEVLERCGVIKPIYVHHLGVSQEFMDHRKKRTRGDKLKFLLIGDRGKRKGWDVGLLAFVRAFGTNEDYQLTLKSRPNVLDNFPITNPNITVIQEDYSNDEMAKLFAEHDVMIFPTRGEGFGLPPREFSATGGIVLATSWSGTADHINQWGFPIDDYTLVPAWQGYNFDDDLGYWADVDVDSLAYQLRDIDENFSKYSCDAYQKSDFVHQFYTWDNFGNNLFNLWEGFLCQQQPSKSQI